MRANPRQVLWWAPRLLGIAFALFVGSFSLDVLGMPIGAGDKVVAFAIHLIPMGIVVAVLAIVWRWEWVGALLFPVLAGVHLALAWGRLAGSAYLFIDGTLVLVGLLFLASWLNRQPAPPSASHRVL